MNGAPLLGKRKLREDEVLNDFFTLQDNKVIKHSFEEGKSSEIFTVDHCFNPRVTFTNHGKVFLIGGSKNKEQTELINKTFEIVLGSKTSLAEKAPMKTGRLSFGCCVDNYGEKIYVTGGAVGKMQATNACEVYDIASNTWSDLPPLNKQKFSLSLVLFNDSQLFALGGIDQELNSTDQIEKLYIGKPDKWELMKVALPNKLTTVGAFQIGLTEILIFGGWEKAGNVKQVSSLKLNGKQWSASVTEIQLGEPDIFLFNGGVRQDIDSDELVVCGSSLMHKFNEKSRKFEVVRKLV